MFHEIQDQTPESATSDPEHYTNGAALSGIGEVDANASTWTLLIQLEKTANDTNATIDSPATMYANEGTEPSEVVPSMYGNEGVEPAEVPEYGNEEVSPAEEPQYVNEDTEPTAESMKPLYANEDMEEAVQPY